MQKMDSTQIFLTEKAPSGMQGLGIIPTMMQ